jgi:ABC-type Fe3+/spermidine/putrescine transport system ATPase subunit
MTEVTLTRLSYAYNQRSKDALALDDVSLQVASGELLAVLGPSGCGKTTLLRLIAGLQKPTNGDIQFDGVSVKGLSPKKRGVMMVFQDDQLFPYMNVFNNVAFGLKSQRIVGRKLRQRVSETLKLVQMSGYERRFPHELSGGEQQRIALARAIAVQPRVLLLDEPLSHLDSTLRDTLRDTIRNIQRQLGITMLFVTHDQVEARGVADRIALLLDGQLRQVAHPDTLYQQPTDEQSARFLGIVNIFDGQVTGRCIRSGLGEVAFANSNQAQYEKVKFMIPTTAVEVCTERTNGTNIFPAQVIDYRHYGNILRYRLHLNNTTLYIDRLQPLHSNAENMLYIYIDPQQVRILP